MYSKSRITDLQINGIDLSKFTVNISDSQRNEYEKKELYEYKKKMNTKSMKEDIHMMLIEYFKNNISEDVIIEYIISYYEKKNQMKKKKELYNIY